MYEKLSAERKQAQEQGLCPEWYTTGGYQLFKEKYQHQDSVKAQFELIARTAANHLKGLGSEIEQQGYDKFFEMLWKGWLSPSTPVLANMGTNKGLPVSCSGNFVEDSIEGFYDAYKEVALLSKQGFGTSSYLGNIRPRGSVISIGGKADGVLPVFKHFIQVSREVRQGSQRRGSWAGYIEITHGDFDELADFVMSDPEDANIGWILTDGFFSEMNKGNTELLRRYQKALKLKMVTGKGYFCKADELNRHRPQMYIDKGMFVKASQLCNEISLFNDKDHTYTCILASPNLAKYREWQNTDMLFWATVFLDCVCEEFIQRARGISGLERAVRFTEKGRALGLGQCGLHTLFQQEMLPFEGLEAHLLSTSISKQIAEESLRASQWLAKVLGEPEWCKGYGVRNTHRTAIAPTKSTALLMGGVSEGINPDPAMTFTQLTAGGEVERVNPMLLRIMKYRDVYNKDTIRDMKQAMGSVQHVTWLSDKEKEVFKTAFELNQSAIIRMAAARTKHLCQWQSLNLFFSAEAHESEVSRVHQEALMNPEILGLYYVYSSAGVQASTGECVACQ